jgi:hypothetical protein
LSSLDGPLIAFALLLASLWSESAVALCAAAIMEGDWQNVGLPVAVSRIALRFKCCDQVFCPIGSPCVTVCHPDKDSVQVYGNCSDGLCNWGQVEPTYSFVDAASGYQYTRVDAQFASGGQAKRLVIILLGNEQLLVHTSFDFPDGNVEKDFSVVEYFERVRCFVVGGRKLCLQKAQKVEPMEFPAPPVIGK